MKSGTAILKLVLACFVSVIASSSRYLEVSEYYAKVYIMPSAGSQFIGLAQKGERYQILSANGTWLQINFKNSAGWVYQGNVKIIDAKGSPAAAAPPPAPAASIPAPETPAVPQQSAAPQIINPVESPAFTEAPSSEVSSAQSTAPAFKPTTQSHRPYISPAQPRPRILQQIPKIPRKRSAWFTQNRVAHVPPDIPGAPEMAQAQKYFQVNTTPARILIQLSPDSPLLGLAKKGDLLILVGEGDSWCKVAYGDSTGWIERRHGKVVTAPSSAFFDDFRIVLLILAIAASIALLVAAIILIRHLRAAKTNQVPAMRKHALIIAKTSQIVQYTLTDTHTTLERCFTEIGFSINIAKDMATARNSIDHNLPDVVLVDWQFERNILRNIEEIFLKRATTTNALFIFYNVPDPAAMVSRSALPNANFLGVSFSDRDIFKLVTPLIITAEKTKTIQKSVQSSALEGDIADGNLLEVLQFIEIGSKTGCVLVDTGQPFGIIYFNQGRIIYSAADNTSGRDAIFAILNLKSGNFRFVLGRQPKSSNVNLSTLEVLMEWTKTLDEAHGR